MTVNDPGFDVLLPATGLRLEARRPLATELGTDNDAKISLTIEGSLCGGG
jgi:hypothetical protein